MTAVSARAASAKAKVATGSSCWQDVLAGLSIAGLLLPEAVAYSGIANLPPQAGVIALFAGLLCYGSFGSSRFAIVSATSSSAAVLAAATASMSGGEPAHRMILAVGLVLLTGIALLLAGLARIGGITHFIARPVLQGFAFGLALVIIVKQLAAIAGIHPLHTDMVRTLMALGAANLLSGLLHGLPVGAGYSATSANEAAGAVSRLAGWAAAAVLFTVVATLLPFIALIPHPVLAAIVIHAVSHTLTFATFRPYFQWERDRLIVVSSVLAVVTLGILDGLLAAIGISLLLMLRYLSKSNVAVLGRLGNSHDYVDCTLHREAQAVPGLLILRPEEALFFANAERIITQAQQRIAHGVPTVDTVILSLEESPDLDSTSLLALDEFTKCVAVQNCQLIFARLKSPAHDVLALLEASQPKPYLTELSADDAVATALRLRQERACESGTTADRGLSSRKSIFIGK